MPAVPYNSIFGVARKPNRPRRLPSQFCLTFAVSRPGAPTTVAFSAPGMPATVLPLLAQATSPSKPRTHLIPTCQLYPAWTATRADVELKLCGLLLKNLCASRTKAVLLGQLAVGKP